MTSESIGASEGDTRLNVILAEFIQQTEAGVNPDPQEIIARHPEFAEELQEFFRDKARFDHIAEPFKPGVDLSPQQASVDATLLSSDAQSNSTSTRVPSIGSKLRYFGDYELLEEIARGGMGVVYKARQSTLKRIVALKMILSGQLAGEEAVARFYAEAEAAAKLDHPNIVPIFEIGQHQGQHFFSMTLVEGESLAHKVAAGPLPPREAAQLMKKIAEAIAYAHVEGVVHRDLKPANVLLDKDGEPRVTDFGLAKHAPAAPLAGDSAKADAHFTVTGQVLGTPGYMPPEQAAGKADEVGILSDVYSLGAMLYCLLTGRPPFQAANPLDTLLQVLHRLLVQDL
jgi:eukaryotic-like serine/threonine-protein kinase